MLLRKKVILIIGGNIESIPGINEAKKNGYITVVTDGNKNAPAKKYSHYFIQADTYDYHETIKKVLRFKKKIDAVMSLSSDVPLTVSKVAKKLKLPSISIKCANIFADKFLMKKEFLKLNILIPKFFLINNLQDLKRKIKKFKKSVIKPVDSRGSRGVYVVKKNTKNLKQLYTSSKSFSVKKKVILEEFLTGQQLSTETIISNGDVKTVAICDRNYEYLKRFQPNIIENGGDLPAKKHLQYKKHIDELVKKICKKLKIKNGTMKGDLIIHKNKIHTIEFAPRLSGGYFSSIMIPESSGINLLKIAFKIHLGELINLNVINYNYKKFISQRFFFPEGDIIKNISYNKNLVKKKEVKFFQFYVAKETKLKKIENHANRGGQVITATNSREKSIKLAKQICNSIKFKFN
jgi:biotin carboxylase